MLKTVLGYGIILAALVVLLKILEHRFFSFDLNLELYIGLASALFIAFGIWIGFKMNPKSETITAQKQTEDAQNHEIKFVDQTILSQRELEVLQMMASGLTNQEIADKLFISLNTVKTHCSNVYVKLNVKRRTQAIQVATDMQLL